MFTNSLSFFCAYIVVVQLLSCVWLFATLWTAACQASVSFTIYWSLLRFMSTESVMLSNISSCATLFSFCLQSFPASGSFLMSWLFTSGGQSTGALASASVLPMDIQDWISFGIDWFDLLVVQGSSQHHNLKASVLQLSWWGSKLKRIWQAVDVE